MESHDAAATFWFKLWPQIEANKNRIIAVTGVVLAIIVIVLFIAWHRDQNRIDAGDALTQSLISTPPNADPSQISQSYLQIADNYAGTPAGTRAMLQGATELFAQGKYSGWITIDGDRAIGSAGLLILDWAPHFLDPACNERGYILNVFVEPEYRGRGLAKSLTKECIDEARRRGIGVVALHASKKGQPIYEKLGFKPSNEMLFVEPAFE